MRKGVFGEMVLEYLISPKEAKRRPWELVAIAFLFVSFGILTQMLIPTLEGSIIIFSLIPLIPLFFFFLLSEEAAEERYSKLEAEVGDWGKVLKTLEAERPHLSVPAAFIHRFKKILHVHRQLIEFFTFVFIGAVFAYAFWFALLPKEVSYGLYFQQLQEVKTISSTVTGQAFQQDVFEFLFNHNIQVLFLMLLFSLVYGVGALYLLLWNASIIGVVLGGKFVSNGLAGAVMGFLGMIPHGIFEISSYFVGALAGGLLSIAVMRSSYKKPFFKYLLEDVFLLAAFALLLLFIGAVIEASY